MEYIAIGLIWWIVMFAVDFFAHLLMPINKPYGMVRLVTYGVPIGAMVVMGSALRDVTYGLVFLSPILMAVGWELVVRFARVLRKGKADRDERSGSST